jgi:hypothetical protein
MTYLTDYISADKPMLHDDTIHLEAIDTICGLLAFPIVEKNTGSEGFTINGYEKSFWSKKLKGSVSLHYVQDAEIREPEYSISAGQELPPYSDILIGMNFWSEYKSIGLTQLGVSRKEVLNLGMLLSNIQAKMDALSQLSVEILSNSNWLYDDITTKLSFVTSQREPLEKLTDMLGVFDKYK